MVERYWTGLPAAEPNEPGTEIRRFRRAVRQRTFVREKCVAHRLTVRMIDDCPRMTKKNSKIKALAKSFAKEISCACRSEIARGS